MSWLRKLQLGLSGLWRSKPFNPYERTSTKRGYVLLGETTESLGVTLYAESCKPRCTDLVEQKAVILHGARCCFPFLVIR